MTPPMAAEIWTPIHDETRERASRRAVRRTSGGTGPRQAGCGLSSLARGRVPFISSRTFGPWDHVLHWTLLSYAFVALGAIFVYELARSLVKRRLRRRFERDLQRFLASPDLYLQAFKFTNKVVIKHQLLADPEVNAKILEFARREAQDIEAVRRKVDGYIDEMVPSFNLLSYYKVGYTIARAFIHSLYDPVVDQERRRILDRLPQDASPVYVMNHRSNVDFVLLAYMLAGRASVSYAMGEWVRVWPLEHLFKSFGSYVVRRGYKEDLYHKVLERFVQLQAKHGVVQAIFPEGQITRDGRLLPPKYGLIQFLAGVEADPEFDRDLTFVPVGVNYDWVLEDRNLVAESEGRPPRQGFWKRFQVIVTGPFVTVAFLLINGVRFAMGRLKLPGYASLSFAEPLVLSSWAHERGMDITTLSYEERKPLIREFAHEVLRRIGEAVPATPVTLLSVGLLDDPRPSYTWLDLVDTARRTRAELEEKGVRVVVGREFAKFRKALHRLDTDERDRPTELDEVTRALVRQEEAEAIVRFATDVLRRNGILVRRGRSWRIRPERENYLRYYANSLAHRLGRDYPITGRAEAREPSP
jgi:glycerol-3-phosphate O-acyltransferase